MLACCHSRQSPSPSSKLDGVASFTILSVPCSRQSRSPSSKLEGVKTIGQHGSRRVTKPLPADGPKNCCQHRLFVRRVKPTPSARVPLAACPPVFPTRAASCPWHALGSLPRGRASMISRFFIDRTGATGGLPASAFPTRAASCPWHPLGSLPRGQSIHDLAILHRPPDLRHGALGGHHLDRRDLAACSCRSRSTRGSRRPA